ncbi:MAG TPA: sialidase family protein, partial [Terriglobia bacterium]|nr:sialidase family protein [Terriglobia bacterium]
PDTFAFNSTIVSVFQVGRYFDGGASDIGFSTSLNGGVSWQNGFLPGITKKEDPANPYDRVSDPTIAYDPKHGMWLAVSLPIFTVGVVAPDVIVNRSTDGITWSDPVTVNPTPGNLDKCWIACDRWPASPHFGNCYVEWDANAGFTNLIQMSTSTDGGLTWSAPLPTANSAGGIGGQPVVQPSDTVVVPILDASGSGQMYSFTSTNGGTSWSATQKISTVSDHIVAGSLRTSPLPSAEVDAAGNVYVAWQDCRFRTGCGTGTAPNDIVMSTSSDGVTWSAPARIPIDAVTSTVDHFIPGIAVDPSTSGATAHLALTYYYYPVSNCTIATCELDVGFISSQDGGATWSAPIQLAGPMELSSLANTSQGVMVGDYISTSFVNGLAFGAFAVANPVSGTVFDEATYSTASGLSALRAAPRRSSLGERPVPNARSDRAPRKTPAKIR